MNMLDDVEFEVTKLTLGPDDMLAVRPTKSISSVMASELRAQLERRLNLSGRVVVLDAGLELAVITKTDAKRAASK